MRAFSGHPPGLSTLFFTELWERFSYYGMRGMLVLFLTAEVATGGMGMTDARAGAILGLYSAGVYLAALPGGWLGDRLLGARAAVFHGGVIIALGHFTMALASGPAFFGGLVLIVIGTGLLKPNVSAIVGELYGDDAGARRDAGFTLFYMGINVGAFLGPLACGGLGERVDWHLGFGCAGVGMVLGLVQYRLGADRLGNAGRPRVLDAGARRALLARIAAGMALALGVALLAFALARAGTIPATVEWFAGATGVVIVAVAAGYSAWLMLAAGLDAGERGRVALVFALFVGAALFWAGFEQAASTLNLFASRHTDRVLLGFELPATWFQSINAFFIIALAPVVGAAWVALDARAPSLPVKFALGLALLGAGFLVLAWGASHVTGDARVGPMWLVTTYFLHTVGELCLSPVGLSAVTTLSPRRLVGQMMGVWFMGAALGNLLAGLAAGRLEGLSPAHLFAYVGVFGCVAAAGFVGLRGAFRRYGGGAG